ncbi:MAG: AraC family transcriptional regulator [Lachnospiraceae bacterium]|nr:AraC family transcriptional regulator [Lachnospiraceae bacterium]
MPGIYIQRWIWIEQGPAVYANELAQRGFALVAAQVDTRIKAAIVTSMYDMSAAARMMQTPEQELSIETLAADIFVNKYYLIRKSQGLLDEEKAISRIAAEMGFYDQSHFDKAFQRIVGISPSEYVHSKKTDSEGYIGQFFTRHGSFRRI